MDPQGEGTTNFLFVLISSSEKTKEEVFCLINFYNLLCDRQDYWSLVYLELLMIPKPCKNVGYTVLGSVYIVTRLNNRNKYETPPHDSMSLT